MYLYVLLDQFQSVLQSSQGKLGFILIYALWVTLLLPGSPPSLLAGFLYGPGEGTLIVFAGSSLGAEISFFLGRYLIQNWVRDRLSKYPRLQIIEKGISNATLGSILLTRLSPLFPFSLLNMMYGVSSISVRNYTLGLVGTLPGTFVLCQFASLAHDLTDVYHSFPDRNNSYFIGVQIIGFISTFILLSVVIRNGDIFTTNLNGKE